MKCRVGFVLIFIGYLALMPVLRTSLAQRPVAVKAGYMPKGEVLRMISGEFNTLVANWSVVRTLFYFGSVFELNQRQITTQPAYGRMYSNLVQALKLDPYNQDIYYFSQATFTWDVGRIKETNKLLEYGMRYRPWDWQLPFWLGFNHAYFLKDYRDAAKYFKKAAELSGNSLFTKLAARYFYESGRGGLGIAFLDGMIKNAKDQKIRKIYTLRRNALVAAQVLRQAIEQYKHQHGAPPDTLQSLVAVGLIASIPEDPYGGDFYLDGSGDVRSTSKFSFTGKNKQADDTQSDQGFSENTE